MLSAARNAALVRFGWLAHPLPRGVLGNLLSLIVGAVIVPVAFLRGVHVNRGVFPYLIGAGSLAALLLVLSWGLTFSRRRLHVRCGELADELRDFLKRSKNHDPVYGPNPWHPEPEIANDTTREPAWRAKRDAAFWQYQGEVAERYHREFMARVLLVLDDVPARPAPQLPREQFSRPRNDSEIKDVVEYLAMTAERLGE